MAKVLKEDQLSGEFGEVDPLKVKLVKSYWCRGNEKCLFSDEFGSQFSVWNESDFRFFDLNKNDHIDVNELIFGHLYEKYTLDKDSANAPLFQTFVWKRKHEHLDEEQSIHLGYILRPLKIINKEGRTEWVCPDANEYDSESLLFSLLEKLIDQETQGLYLAVPNKQEVAKSPEFLFITEDILESVGIMHYKGNDYLYDENLYERTSYLPVRIHWPYDFDDPLTLRKNQKVFWIKHPSEVPSLMESDFFQRAPIWLDKKIGCVPVGQ